MEFAKLTPQQLSQAIELTRRVFDEFEAPAYSPEGVEAFYTYLEPKNLLEQWQKGRLLIWGAFDADKLAGIIALTNLNHVSLLFVDKAYQRRGLASQLFHLMMAYCIQKAVKTVTVNADINAVSIYQRLGFVAMDAVQERNGIRFIPMQYNI